MLVAATGSGIEQWFIDAWHEAFSRHGGPTDLSIAMLLNDLVPLSKLMSEQIGALRKGQKAGCRGRPRTIQGRSCEGSPPQVEVIALSRNNGQASSPGCLP